MPDPPATSVIVQTTATGIPTIIEPEADAEERGRLKRPFSTPCILTISRPRSQQWFPISRASPQTSSPFVSDVFRLSAHIRPEEDQAA
ncbi:hypothetical protein J4E85_004748 [Alternaria conjuncta]|uniref:uncharacterized protein n=1 Tax=Alternaria conjuncta TaxID=181017 RepID=UPI0022202DC3|nr:uncharacterized protein J4E85_004748 [Alternaria conjuncta]KAI4930124.1 hypothetical protein J4E85_004748 [Alternaria conjuncta]